MEFTRREMLVGSAGVIGAAVLAGCQNTKPESSSRASSLSNPTIDRHAVISRHNPMVQKLDPYAALTVGNGSFAFTADITGLQTFLDPYNTDFPLCTMATWAWHTTPPDPGIDPANYRYKLYDSHGRQVPYDTDVKGQAPLANWMRENPHRMHIGRVGLVLEKPDGTEALPRDVTTIQQWLELWTGIQESQFQFAGQRVRVRTTVHPAMDALAIRIDSPLIRNGQLSVRIAFPYPTSAVNMADWRAAEKHRSNVVLGDHRADITRHVDESTYHVAAAWRDGGLKQAGPHEFVLSGSGASLECTIVFSPTPGGVSAIPMFKQIASASTRYWEDFWTEGAAIDLSASTDPRAAELERRIVLSQYNTALHCAGPMPPSETGLLFNSWYGKSHLEMHWWHGVHFAAWNRLPLFERSLDFYQRILPVARDIAVRQGYEGVRWPKMVGPEGLDSPSPVGPLLIWQQPHPIYYAELCYQHNPTPETLQQWQEIVEQTARFMASYAFLQDNRYVLGPPLKTVSENTDPLTTTNATFELAYWRFGLATAQKWRQRRGLLPDPHWADVLSRLAPLPQAGGRYLMQEGMTDTYSKWNWEHPALLGAYGMQPPPPAPPPNRLGVDPSVMRQTLAEVMKVWQWDRCWGWDFPMTAMTAARVGELELAFDALLIDSPKNHYHPNGHVYQRPGLTAYLPANGGLLSAIAILVTQAKRIATADSTGWLHAGNWALHSEGISPLL
ncbi:MAG TPA: glycoside hydrolase family 65 [Phycisphaerae bacterium]|nr:glycoside hydrolase family 65 [Phycisphaerae bacterium]